MARLLNLGLRGATLLLKFLLLLVLAKYLSIERMGHYGLFVAAVSYSIYILGFDFYNYSHRELLASDDNAWGRLLFNHGAFLLLMYCLALPLLLTLFIFDLLQWELCLLFYGVLIGEHAGLELGRLLVCRGKVLASSLVLFIRNGIWVIPIAIAALLNLNPISLKEVLSVWAIFGLFSIVAGVYFLYASGVRVQYSDRQLDSTWIKAGLRIALPLLGATLALRAIYTLDRYFIEFFDNLAAVGAYTFFIGIANTIIAFLEAALFSFAYARIVSAYQNQDYGLYQQLFKRLATQTLLIVVLLGGLAVAGIHLLVFEILDKPEYQQYLGLSYFVVAAIFLQGLSMVPNLGLYAQGKDRSLIGANLLALVAFLLVAVLFGRESGAYGVVYAILTSSAILLVAKSLLYSRGLKTLKST